MVSCEAGSSESPPKPSDINALTADDLHAELLAFWQVIIYIHTFFICIDISYGLLVFFRLTGDWRRSGKKAGGASQNHICCIGSSLRQDRSVLSAGFIRDEMLVVPEVRNLN